MKEGQVVYADLKRQLGFDPCNNEGGEAALAGINYPSYALREVIREGVSAPACACEDATAPCGAPLPAPIQTAAPQPE